MLKNITIFGEKLTYLDKDYAIAFKDPDFLPKFLRDVDKEMSTRGYYEKEVVIDVLTLKIICYKIKDPYPLFFGLTFDDSTDAEKIFERIQDLIDITLDYIETTNSLYEIHNPEALESDCDEISKEFLLIRPPKISIIGADRVGKTTICEMLKSGILPDEGIYPFTIEKYYAQLFDIPITIWDVKITDDWRASSKYIMGSDGVIIVLDSTLQNARYSKALLEMTEEVIPGAEVLVIANKQDVEGALKPEELEEILNCKVFPFVASNYENQQKILIQAAKLLEIKAPEIDYSEEDYIIQRTE